MKKIRVYATIKIKVTFTNWVKQTNYNRSYMVEIGNKIPEIFFMSVVKPKTPASSLTLFIAN